MKIKDVKTNKGKFEIKENGEEKRIYSARTNKCIAIIKKNGDVYSPSSGRKVGTNGDYSSLIETN